MRFMVLMAEADLGSWERASQEHRDRLFEHHRRYDAAVREQGRMLVGEALASPDRAVTLRPGRGPARPLTDGPYAETGQQLGGFYLIDVDSVETAVELARLLPDGYSIEVRPVIPIERHDR
jgi:hypothetical protein